MPPPTPLHPDLADSLRAHRVHVRVDLVDPRDVDARHVGIDRDVVAREIVIQVVAEPLVHAALRRETASAPSSG
jgi:hypothetical protein